MAMFLIAGRFRITGAQPDGDSIRFAPNDPAQWDLITGPNKVKRNASGAAQLRMDAIDTLETHYGESADASAAGVGACRRGRAAGLAGFHKRGSRPG